MLFADHYGRWIPRHFIDEIVGVSCYDQLHPFRRAQEKLGEGLDHIWMEPQFGLLYANQRRRIRMQ